MDLFFREAADWIGDEDVLSKIDALMDRRAFSPIQTRGLGRLGIGPRGNDSPTAPPDPKSGVTRRVDTRKTGRKRAWIGRNGR